MNVIFDVENISKDQYENVIEKFISTITKNGFVKSIYQFGKIRNPGISDIDLLVIVNDLDDCSKEGIDSIYAATQETSLGQYCFWHKPIVITIDELNYLYNFHTVTNLTLLYGEHTVNRDHIFHLKEYLQPYWNVFFIEVGLSLLQKRRASLRLLLLLLNNLLFSIKENDVLFKTCFSNEIIKDVERVRASVFEAKDHCKVKEDAKKLLHRSLATIKKQESCSALPYTFEFICSRRFVYVVCPLVSFWYLLQRGHVPSKTLIFLPQRYFAARTILLKNLKSLSDRQGTNYTNDLLRRLTFPLTFGLSEEM